MSFFEVWGVDWGDEVVPDVLPVFWLEVGGKYDAWGDHCS